MKVKILHYKPIFRSDGFFYALVSILNSDIYLYEKCIFIRRIDFRK
jgi:hypothetical protein